VKIHGSIISAANVFEFPVPHIAYLCVKLIRVLQASSEKEIGHHDRISFDAFMKAWGEENQSINDEIVPAYPDIRTIAGEYLMRKITIKQRLRSRALPASGRALFY
jgi:hypothetical protein